MNRLCVLVYGGVNYLIFLGVFLYAIGFVGGFFVPTRLDGPLSGSLPTAVCVNLALVLLFGLQHSVMARPWFKKWLTRFVPAVMERSTYMLLTNLALMLLFWQWRPMGGIIWQVESSLWSGALWGLFACGWLTVLITTFLINHFDLFGLRQVWFHLQGKKYVPLKFATPGPYQFVRHPLYVGWLLAFWATPQMGTAHLLFALGMTAYILTAIRFEERDLVDMHGDSYESYRRQVPMLIPRLRMKSPNPRSTPARPGVEPVTAAEIERVHRPSLSTVAARSR